MKATLENFYGEYYLRFPKSGLAPMLVLEFIAQSGSKVRHVREDGEHLLISFKNFHVGRDYEYVINYINDNA